MKSGQKSAGNIENVAEMMTWSSSFIRNRIQCDRINSARHIAKNIKNCAPQEPKSTKKNDFRTKSLSYVIMTSLRKTEFSPAPISRKQIFFYFIIYFG